MRSILVAMMKSFSCSPLIFLVCRETVALQVFEMPILGYLGYPFFGLIVFSYAALILNFIAKQDLAKLFSSQS
jgi:hypothetical protein